MQHCLSFRGLRSLDSRALPWTHGELTAAPRPPAAFSNDLWSLHVVPTAQLPQDWEFFLFSYWDWDVGLFQCWELGSEPPPSGPSNSNTHPGEDLGGVVRFEKPGKIL